MGQNHGPAKAGRQLLVLDDGSNVIAGGVKRLTPNPVQQECLRSAPPQVPSGLARWLEKLPEHGAIAMFGISPFVEK